MYLFIYSFIHSFIHAAQKESFSPSGPKISITGWQDFIAGCHLCHPVVVLKDALICRHD